MKDYKEKQRCNFQLHHSISSYQKRKKRKRRSAITGYSAKVGSFNIDTAKTVGQTQSIAGVGFQPKIVLFWWGGSTGTADGVAGGNIYFGFGSAVSSSSRFSCFALSDDAAGISAVLGGVDNISCIYAVNSGGTGVGVADFASMDADGFTLTIDTQFTSAYRVSYLALGGTDLINVYIGSKQRAASTGNCAVTDVGFQPDAVIIAPTAFTTNTAGLGEAVERFSLGWATGASNQGLIATWGQDNVDTSNTRGYGYNGECGGMQSSASAHLFMRDTFVSFDADGFTLNQLEGTGQYYYYFIALKGGQYKVHELTTRTDGNDIVESDVGFQPVAVLFASANRALSTQDVATDHLRLSIGAATSASNRACMAVSDEDNLGDTETAYSNSDSLVYQQIVDDAQVGGMDIKSIDSGGFTCVMDDPDPSACWVTYLAIGAAGGGTSVNVSDTASIVDSTVLSASLSELDQVLGTDSTSELASLFLYDPTESSDQIQSLASLSLPEVGIGIDTPSLAAEFGLTDNILGGDFIDLSALLSIYDTASIVEDITIVISGGIISGSTVWGHITGVLETNIRTFVDNWTGTGAITGSGDDEKLSLNTDEYMISEVVNTGVYQVTLLQNEYASGDTVTLQYRHGATQAACEAASWNDYTVPFDSLGYVQIRVEN